MFGCDQQRANEELAYTIRWSGSAHFIMIITTGCKLDDNLKLTWWHINIYKCNMLRMAIYNDVNLKLTWHINIYKCSADCRTAPLYICLPLLAEILPLTGTESTFCFRENLWLFYLFANLCFCHLLSSPVCAFFLSNIGQKSLDSTQNWQKAAKSRSILNCIFHQ